jgi:hypothetical protein
MRITFITGFVAGLALGTAVMIALSTNPYKRGQVDALTGKIKYHLVTNIDSTKTWEDIKP